MGNREKYKDFLRTNNSVSDEEKMEEMRVPHSRERYGGVGSGGSGPGVSNLGSQGDFDFGKGKHDNFGHASSKGAQSYKRALENKGDDDEEKPTQWFSSLNDPFKRDKPERREGGVGKILYGTQANGMSDSDDDDSFARSQNGSKRPFEEDVRRPPPGPSASREPQDLEWENENNRGRGGSKYEGFDSHIRTQMGNEAEPRTQSKPGYTKQIDLSSGNNQKNFNFKFSVSPGQTSNSNGTQNQFAPTQSNHFIQIFTFV